MTQRALADKVDVSPQAVNQWIKTGEIAQESLISCCNILQIRSDWLLTGEGEMERAETPPDGGGNAKTATAEAMGEFAVAESANGSLFLSPEESRLLKQYRSLPPTAQLHLTWLVSCCAALGNEAYRDWEDRIAAFNKTRDKTKAKT